MGLFAHAWYTYPSGNAPLTKCLKHSDDYSIRAGKRKADLLLPYPAEVEGGAVVVYFGAAAHGIDNLLAVRIAESLVFDLNIDFASVEEDVIGKPLGNRNSGAAVGVRDGGTHGGKGHLTDVVSPLTKA